MGMGATAPETMAPIYFMVIKSTSDLRVLKMQLEKLLVMGEITEQEYKESLLNPSKSVTKKLQHKKYNDYHRDYQAKYREKKKAEEKRLKLLHEVELRKKDK